MIVVVIMLMVVLVLVIMMALVALAVAILFFPIWSVLPSLTPAYSGRKRPHASCQSQKGEDQKPNLLFHPAGSGPVPLQLFLHPNQLCLFPIKCQLGLEQCRQTGRQINPQDLLPIGIRTALQSLQRHL